MKRIILIIPIIACGLISCNNYKEVTNEAASKIASNIVSNRKNLDEYQKKC